MHVYERGRWEISVPPPQFHCEPKYALKNLFELNLNLFELNLS